VSDPDSQHRAKLSVVLEGGPLDGKRLKRARPQACDAVHLVFSMNGRRHLYFAIYLGGDRLALAYRGLVAAEASHQSGSTNKR
jgi:hypothetical protein